MSTNTHILHPQFGREFLAAAAHTLRALGDTLFRAPAETPEASSQRLRAMAADYEATQPSFAADLRAAADQQVA